MEDVQSLASARDGPPRKRGPARPVRFPGPHRQGRISVGCTYLVGYNTAVIEVRQTEVYERWFRRLRDRQAQARISVRVRRLSLGNPGDVRPVGGGVSELRIDHGPGYRVYFVQEDQGATVLLLGGDKRTQSQDIERARDLVRALVEGGS